MDWKELRDWRKQHQITQRELGFFFGVSTKTVVAWETPVPGHIEKHLPQLLEEKRQTGRVSVMEKE